MDDKLDRYEHIIALVLMTLVAVMGFLLIISIVAPVFLPEPTASEPVCIGDG